ncbi:MAG: hypothetical protein WBA76_00390 [Phormidesmis sp.]
MFMPFLSDALAFTASPAASASSNPSPETVRHMLIGSPSAVQSTIQLLHKLNYAEPNSWSLLIPTSRPNEVMAILTKRARGE